MSLLKRVVSSPPRRARLVRGQPPGAPPQSQGRVRPPAPRCGRARRPCTPAPAGRHTAGQPKLVTRAPTPPPAAAALPPPAQGGGGCAGPACRGEGAEAGGGRCEWIAGRTLAGRSARQGGLRAARRRGRRRGEEEEEAAAPATVVVEAEAESGRSPLGRASGHACRASSRRGGCRGYRSGGGSAAGPGRAVPHTCGAERSGASRPAGPSPPPASGRGRGRRRGGSRRGCWQPPAAARPERGGEEEPPAANERGLAGL